MTDRRTAGIIALYVAIGVVSFGHAAANTPTPKCDPFCITTRGERAVIAGMGAFFMWPFYWSWEAFERGN